MARPSRVVVTVDTVQGVKYSMAAEDLRFAADTEAPKESTLPSSFCKINGDPGSDTVTFYDGHWIWAYRGWHVRQWIR